MYIIKGKCEYSKTSNQLGVIFRWRSIERGNVTVTYKGQGDLKISAKNIVFFEFLNFRQFQHIAPRQQLQNAYNFCLGSLIQ